MSGSSEIEGAALAKSISNTANARDVLQRTERGLTAWNLAVVLVCNGLAGAFLADTHLSRISYANNFAGMLAFAGFSAAFIAIAECRRLHKRLNAAVVLLSAQAKG